MESSCHVIGRHDDGPVLHIVFAGVYPMGSAGNPSAARMREFTAAAVLKHSPSAVVFDLLDVEYRWGDGICQIALPLRRVDGSLVPARILARGETADALAPLLGPNWLLGVAGVTRSDSLEQALQDFI